MAEGAPVGIGTSQEGSLVEAALGVGTWPKASGPGSPMLVGPSSHCEAEEKALGVAGACQGRVEGGSDGQGGLRNFWGRTEDREEEGQRGQEWKRGSEGLGSLGASGGLAARAKPVACISELGLEGLG